MKISIIVPIHNEEENLRILADRVEAVLAGENISNAELILVNDGSRDRSLEIIKSLASEKPFIRYISLSRNFGHQQAMSAGLDHCRGKYVVLMDGDLQDPPELIPLLLKKAEEGYKVVYAKRRSREDESRMKKWTAALFYRMMKRITSIDMPLDTGDFRLIHRDVLLAVKTMKEYNKFLRGQIAWLGFSQSYVLFDREGRRHGETSYTFAKQMKLALIGITSFSNFPLRLASWMGFIVSAVAFILLIYSLVSNVVFHSTVSGWTSLMIAITFLGGIQLVAIGVIGTYISRINEEVRNRPVYVVDEASVEKDIGH